MTTRTAEQLRLFQAVSVFIQDGDASAVHNFVGNRVWTAKTLDEARASTNANWIGLTSNDQAMVYAKIQDYHAQNKGDMTVITPSTVPATAPKPQPVVPKKQTMKTQPAADLTIDAPQTVTTITKSSMPITYQDFVDAIARTTNYNLKFDGAGLLAIRQGERASEKEITGYDGSDAQLKRHRKNLEKWFAKNQTTTIGAEYRNTITPLMDPQFFQELIPVAIDTPDGSNLTEPLEQILMMPDIFIMLMVMAPTISDAVLFAPGTWAKHQFFVVAHPTKPDVKISIGFLEAVAQAELDHDNYVEPIRRAGWAVAMLLCDVKGSFLNHKGSPLDDSGNLKSTVSDLVDLWKEDFDGDGVQWATTKISNAKEHLINVGVEGRYHLRSVLTTKVRNVAFRAK